MFEVKKLFVFVFLATLVTASADPEGEIRKAFEGYKTAVKEGDYDHFIKFSGQPMVDHIKTIKQNALTQKKEDLMKESYMSLFMTLQLRVLFTTDELKQASPVDIIRKTMEENPVGKEAILKQGIGDITIDGNKAEAAILYNGKPLTGMKLYFVKEGSGMWIQDTAKAFLEANKAVDGQKFDEKTLLMMMKMSLKKHEAKITSQVFEPLL